MSEIVRHESSPSTKASSVKECLTAVWQDWGPRVTGTLTIPFALVGVYWDNARLLFFILSAIALVLTFYFVWASERTRVCALELQLKERRDRKAIRIRLGEALRKAEALKFDALRKPPEEQGETLLEWLAPLTEYLRDSLGHEYLDRFHSTTDIVLPLDTGQGTYQQVNIYNTYRRQIIRLHEFIKEFDDV